MSINWTEEEWQEFREGFYERDQTQSTETTRSEPAVTDCEHLFCVVGERMYFFTYCPYCGVKL